MTRAKFYVQKVEKFKVSQDIGYMVTLNPVAGGSPENEKFYKWTPSGEIRIGTINKGSADEFEIGQEFYVDFTKAETGK